MHAGDTLDCRGLSNAPVVLRIKQALVGHKRGDGRMGVLIGEGCDLQRIAGSLGPAAERVKLVPAAT